jgi:sodium/potassium/calcium exchanger 6
MLVTAIAGFAVGSLVLIFSENGAHPTAKIARCGMGFFVAIIWIMAIADEVVHVLQVRFSRHLLFGYLVNASH